MSVMAEEFSKHIAIINEIMNGSNRIKSILGPTPLKDLAYEQIFRVVYELVNEINNLYDFRPFFPKGNPAFYQLALHSACEMYQLEDINSPAIDSPSAATFFAMRLGEVQMMVCLTERDLSNWFSKHNDLPNLESYSKTAAKRSGPYLREISGKLPSGERPKGCMLLLVAGLFTVLSSVMCLAVKF